MQMKNLVVTFQIISLSTLSTLFTLSNSFQTFADPTAPVTLGIQSLQENIVVKVDRNSTNQTGAVEIFGLPNFSSPLGEPLAVIQANETEHTFIKELTGSKFFRGVPRYPRAMAALGDSLTSALFSDTTVSPPPSLVFLIEVGNDFQDLTEDEFAAKYEKKDLSWATGISISTSHSKQIEQGRGNSLPVVNFAKFGTTSSALRHQIDSLLAMEAQTEQPFDYITLFVGINSFDRESIEEITPTETFRDDIDSALDRLLTASPQRRLTIVGLPKIFRYLDATVSTPLIPGFLNCDQVRKLVHGEGNVLLTPPNSAIRLEVETRMQEYETTLDSIVEQKKNLYPLTRWRIVRDYESSRAPIEILAGDCFHLNAVGQTDLATKIWNKSFWN